MAIEDVQRFLDALDNDEDLAVQADDAFVAALQGVASEAGFDFSEEDLRSVLDGAGSLSDAELDEVAGGAYVSGATMDTISSGLPGLGGGTFDTVYGGTSGLLVRPTLTRFSSFSKNGFSR